MRIATCSLKSVAPYGQSRNHDTPKLSKEGHDAYEQRTWLNRLHITEEGYVFIPGNCFKLCLGACPKYLGEKIPGKGQATYTKHFEVSSRPRWTVYV